MKSLKSLMACILLVIAANANAASLEVADVQINPGERTTVSVNFNNNGKEYVMVEFWMSLPDGVNIPMDDEGYYMAEGNSNRFKRTHMLEVSQQDGYYHFLIYSSRNEAFKGTSGELLNFTIEAASNITNETHTAKIFNQLLNDTDKNEYMPKDVDFNISVTEATNNITLTTDESVSINAESTCLLSICLNNGSTEVYGMQFDIHLPEGLTITDVIKTERCGKKDIQYAMQETSGHYRVLVFSSDLTSILGENGEIMQIELEASSIKEGTYTGLIDKIELAVMKDNDFSPIYLEECSFVIVVNTVIHMDNLEVTEMEQGSTNKYSVSLNNPDTEYIMLEFWVSLPNGFSIPKDEDGYFMAEGNNERFKRSHTLEVSEQDGNYHFLIFSSRNEAFNGNSGELFNFRVEGAKGIQGGAFTGKIFNQLYNDTLKNEYKPEDVIFSLNVTDGINSNVLKGKVNLPTYNLQGIRVDSPKNGIYIQNGRKVLMK